MALPNGNPNAGKYNGTKGRTQRTIVCDECGESITVIDVKARFCSGYCRLRHWLKQQRQPVTTPLQINEVSE
jgi:hypothetical protein